jgi:hypothetical protein
MPRHCTVCASPARSTIDECLVAGAALAALSREYGLSEDALARHKSKHLPEVLVKGYRAAETERGASMLDQLRSLQARAAALLDSAEGAGTLRTAVAAVHEIRECLRLEGQVLGQLDDGVRLNLLIGTAVQIGDPVPPKSDFDEWSHFLYPHELDALSETTAIFEHLRGLALSRRADGEKLAGSPPEWVGRDCYDVPHHQGNTPWLQIGRDADTEPYLFCLLREASQP